jgi:hypothetical protein
MAEETKTNYENIINHNLAKHCSKLNTKRSELMAERELLLIKYNEIDTALKNDLCENYIDENADELEKTNDKIFENTDELITVCNKLIEIYCSVINIK